MLEEIEHVTDLTKSKEQWCRKEIEQLQKGFKMTDQEPSEADDKLVSKDKYKETKDTKDYLENFLVFCERQYDNRQEMLTGLIKVIAEVGSFKSKVNCLNELCDFTTDFQEQEEQFFSQIDNIPRKEQLTDAQAKKYEKFKKRHTEQKNQFKGIRTFLASQTQGKFKSEVRFSKK